MLEPVSSQGVIPQLTGFAAEAYKAFHRRVAMHLGRLTLLIGRNNAGKTALLFAPLYATHALDPEARTPFPTSRHNVDFGSLRSVCFQKRPSGLSFTMELSGVADAEHDIGQITLGAASIPERGHTQLVTELDIERSDGSHQRLTNVEWQQARERLRRYPALRDVARGVEVLRGVRPPGKRLHAYPGHVPESVGPDGENAAAILAAADDAGFARVSDWFECMGSRLEIARVRDDDFEVLASGKSGALVNLVDSGAGVGHVLPLVVAVRLAKGCPSLLCIEQPELHLHPRAHVEVAELLIESMEKRPDTRLLVETHSDVLILRIRRAIAEQRISHEDVRIYFIDDSENGSEAKEIRLNDRGSPDWWPKGVFAEPQTEYFAIQRALARRDGQG